MKQFAGGNRRGSSGFLDGVDVGALKIGMLLLCICFLPACLGPVKDLYPPSRDVSDFTMIYVMSHGWHTSVVFDRSEARPYLPVLDREFPNARFLEAGWGDQEFYRAKGMNTGLALGAIFLPTDSVLHIVAMHSRPQQYYPNSQTRAILVSKPGYQEIIQYINNSFWLDKNGQNSKLGKGLFGDSQFYRAKGTYHAFNTCNNWTAKAIRASGFPITPFYAVTANNVMYQLRSHSITIKGNTPPSHRHGISD